MELVFDHGGGSGPQSQFMSLALPSYLHPSVSILHLGLYGQGDSRPFAPSPELGTSGFVLAPSLYCMVNFGLIGAINQGFGPFEEPEFFFQFLGLGGKTRGMGRS